MDDEAGVRLEEEIGADDGQGFEDDPTTSQVDELLDRLDADLQSRGRQYSEILPDSGLEERREEITENEPTPENSRDGILDKLTENGFSDSVPPEIVGQFGEGQWSKTYEEHGEAKFDFQTGEMMSKDGSVSLTRQIKEGATGQQIALHEQVGKNWMENAGAAQLIAYKKTTENGIVVHVTKTWVETDGQIASENWSKAIEKEVEKPEQQPGQINIESALDDLDDDRAESYADEAVGRGVYAFNTESASTSQAAKEEVAAAETQPESSGIGLQQDLDDGYVPPTEFIQPAMQEAVPQAENIQIASEILSSSDNIEIDGFDDGPIQASVVKPVTETADIPVAQEIRQAVELNAQEAAAITIEQKQANQPSVEPQNLEITLDIAVPEVSNIEYGSILEDDGDVLEPQIAFTNLQESAPERAVENQSAIGVEAQAHNETSGIELVESGQEETETPAAQEMDFFNDNILPVEQFIKADEHIEIFEDTGIALLEDSEVQDSSVPTAETEAKADVSVHDRGIKETETVERVLTYADVQPVELNNSEVPEQTVQTGINILREDVTEKVQDKVAVIQEQKTSKPDSLTVLTKEMPANIIKPIEIPSVAAKPEISESGIVLAEVEENQNGRIVESNIRMEKTDTAKAETYHEIKEASKAAPIKTIEKNYSGIVIESTADFTQRQATRNETAVSQRVGKIENAPEVVPMADIKDKASGISIEPASVSFIEKQNTRTQNIDQPIDYKAPEIELVKPAATVEREERAQVQRVENLAVRAKKTTEDFARQINSQRTEVANSKPETTTPPERQTPVFMAEQPLRVEQAKSNVININSEKSETAKAVVRPIIVKVSPSRPLPFRSAELVSRLLTFKPPVVTGGDEEFSEASDFYIPEFELAA